MRVLIVSYAYSPDNAPRAYRWSTIAEHWARQGHDVDVVSAWRSGDARSETRAGVAVHRVGGRLSETLRRRLGRRAHRDETAAATVGQRPMAVRLAKYAYDATWRNVYWPDYAGPWALPALRTATALCRRRTYDAIISVSHPFTGHLVGLNLKRRFPGTTWIADVGDPFSLLTETPTNNAALYAGLNRWIDRRVGAAADFLSVTVGNCRDAYVAAFPALDGKIHVIPPLLPEALGPDSPAESLFPNDPEALKLVFTGRLYRGLRSPEYLFSLMAQLVARNPHVHLHFFGDLNDCRDAIEPYREGLGRNLHLHGMVGRDRVLRAQREADVLVNIGNESLLQLPSKIPEYIAAGRPILNIASRSEDTSARALADHPSTLNVVRTGGQPDDLTIDRVARFVSGRQRISAEKIEALTAPYRIGNVAERYRQLILAKSSGSLGAEAAKPSIPEPERLADTAGRAQTQR